MPEGVHASCAEPRSTLYAIETNLTIIRANFDHVPVSVELISGVRISTVLKGHP
jgi:hypothetical protein